LTSCQLLPQVKTLAEVVEHIPAKKRNSSAMETPPQQSQKKKPPQSPRGSSHPHTCSTSLMLGENPSSFLFSFLFLFCRWR